MPFLSAPYCNLKLLPSTKFYISTSRTICKYNFYQDKQSPQHLLLIDSLSTNKYQTGFIVNKPGKDQNGRMQMHTLKAFYRNRPQKLTIF